jgi:hypothetical protein
VNRLDKERNIMRLPIMKIKTFILNNIHLIKGKKYSLMIQKLKVYLRETDIFMFYLVFIIILLLSYLCLFY